MLNYIPYNSNSKICEFYHFLLRISEFLDDSVVKHIPLVVKNKKGSYYNTNKHNATISNFRFKNSNIFFKQNSKTILPNYISNTASISLIIPTAGNIELLDKFLYSIFKYSKSYNYNIILITHKNNLNDKTKLTYFNKVKRNKLQIIKHEFDPFNYSKIINKAVSFSNSEFICLLNDDMEILNYNWLSELLRWFNLEDTGIVGPLLLYPNNKIQHAGISLGLNFLCDHPEKSLYRFNNFRLPYLNYPHYVTAVTGACQLMKRNTFVDVGGLNIRFAEAFNDVDLCLRVKNRGFKIVYTPHCVIRHHESVSVGNPLEKNRINTFKKETNLFLTLHEKKINKEFFTLQITPNPSIFSISMSPIL